MAAPLLITLPDGKRVLNTAANRAILSNTGGLSPRVRREGPEGTGSDISTTEGGTDFVNPSHVNFEEIAAPEIDFESAFDFAQGVGEENRDIFFGHLTNPKTKAAALDLVKTDVEGIKLATDSLSPYIREQGRQDTGENIKRAGQIDEFNFSRIPGFNDFNRGEREKSIEASGLDYRKRITDVLDQLQTQSTGRMSDPLLDTLMSVTARDRGADIGAASGVSGRSGAGVNIQDKLDVNQRVALAMDAQHTIPGVLTQGQAVLQPPDVLATPTNVPLNTSNIADKIPVTSNISAGQAQHQIANEATSIETIPATVALQENLGAQQFNATGEFQRDQFVLSAQESQLNATDAAVQTALNQEHADAQFQAGLDQRRESANIAAGANIISGIGGALLGAPAGGGNSVAGNIIRGTGSILVDGVSSVIDAGVGAVDSIFGDGDGKITIGGHEISGDAFRDSMNAASNWFNGSVNPTSATIPTQINGSNIIEQRPWANGDVMYMAENGSTKLASEFREQDNNGGLTGPFSKVTQPIKDSGIDASTVMQTAGTLMSWGNMSPSQQMSSAGNIGINVLKNQGVISPERANDISAGANALSIIANPSASPAEKAIALASAGATAATHSFTGTIGNPGSIAGNRVIGSTLTPDGQPAFQLDNGEIVPRSALEGSSAAISGLHAFSVLASNAPTEQKLAALSGIGIQSGVAHDLISQVAGGNVLAGLSIFNTGTNWENMNPLQQGASVLQTSNAVFSAMSNSGAIGTAGSGSSISFASSAGEDVIGDSAFASIGSNVGAGLSGAAGIAGIALGIDTAADVIDSVKSMPRSQSFKPGVTGMAAAGAEIAAGVAGVATAYSLATTGATIGSTIPVVGTIIGAAVGAAAGAIISFTGSGKDSGQKMRDSWRDGLRSSGMVKVDKGAWNVTLADGSKYDIGKDGSNKVKNLDGSERNTFDVDWNNPTAVNSIPDAHLFAIASGLDPTDNSKFDSFHRAVGQSLSAATSNTNDLGGVRNNIKSMMAGVDPRELAMRVETLRATDKINDQEYGVYIDRINKMYGTQLAPTDRKKAVDSIVSQLQGQKKLGDVDKQLLAVLIDKKKLAENRQRLENRIKVDYDNIKFANA